MEKEEDKEEIRDATEVLAIAPHVKHAQLSHAEDLMEKVIKNPPNRATRRALRKAMRKQGAPPKKFRKF